MLLIIPDYKTKYYFTIVNVSVLTLSFQTPSNSAHKFHLNQNHKFPYQRLKIDATVITLKVQLPEDKLNKF